MKQKVNAVASTSIPSDKIQSIGILAQDPNNSYEKIAGNFGITKERVRQILNRYFPDLINKRKEDRKVLCGTCNEFKIKTSFLRKKNICNDCQHKFRLKNAGRWQLNYDNCIVCHKTTKPHHSHGVCDSCYTTWAYHNIEGRREKVVRNNKKWATEHPDIIRAICRRATNNYHKRLKANPEKYRAYLKHQNDTYHTKMKDPVFKEKMRVYYQQRALRNKLK